MTRRQIALTASFVCLGLMAASVDAAMVRIDENDASLDAEGWFSWAEPLNTGDPVWFDILVHDGMGEMSQNVQITLSVVPLGAGSMGFDGPLSEAVQNDTNYWLFGNSVGPGAIDLGSNIYQFGDSPDDGIAQLFEDGDILARFAFTWDGIEDDYLVTVDEDILNTFYLDENFSPMSPSWLHNPVTLQVSEPTTICFLVLGALPLVRRRRQRILPLK